MTGNHRWVLARRPGELLVRSVLVPVDPGMRAALLDTQVEVAEFAPIPIGSVVGYVSLWKVEQSCDPRFSPGDWGTDLLFWQEYAIARADTARKVNCANFASPDWLGILGIPGLRAWSGMVCLGRPRNGETVVVTSAAGTVGSIAGQIARNLGCRVVGVAGGERKCQRLIDGLGFDATVDYRAEPDLTRALRKVCPREVDVLLDNVGSAMIDAVIPTMRVGGRILVCGQVAEYHFPVDRRPGLRQLGRFVSYRLTMRGLFVHDHAARWEEAIAQMSQWMAEGKLKLDERYELNHKTFRPAAIGRRLA